MKKITLAGLLVFPVLFACSQEQGNNLPHPQVKTKGIKLLSGLTIAPLQLPFSLPDNGALTETHNEAILYTANSKNGKLNGRWQSWYLNGITCDSGIVVKNLPDGEWKHWNKEGQLIAVRNYSADKFHRVLDEMLRFNAKRNFYYLAALYQKNRPAALQYLSAFYSFPAAGQDKQHTSLKDLVQSNISGSSYKPVFDHCLLDGEYINYFDNGIVKDSGYYKNGLRNGKWIHRDSVGSVWLQGAYQNGHRIKEWKVYDRNNKLIELLFYNHSGQLSWQKKINRQGS
jgi:antitoxin component YwqK of YwqJK toxin-antitoxin module